jgi:hypothetical protein
MGRNARLKRERREKRKALAADQRREIGFVVEPCSNRRCPERRPPGTHVIMRKDGAGNYSSCDTCVKDTMLLLKQAGIDAQVATVGALAQMRDHPPVIVK